MPAIKNKVDIEEEIRKVIQVEMAALQRACASVNGAYTRAVEAMFRCRGKIIVTGMGKSGLIAQKIAATLASTGSPALYLHPADAMHGDLGTLQKQDVVLAFGKSGESEEVNVLLPAIKKIGAKLIAVVTQAESTLAQAADLCVVLPIDKEACPLNLAPTSSTTAALAVGDAFSVALMKMRAFKPSHFALLHPGGSLGKRLTLTVENLMKKGSENPTVTLDQNLSQMLVEMTRTHCGAASVVDKRGRLVGLVTDYDIRKALERHGRNWVDLSISQIMNPRPTTVYSDQLAYEASTLMGGKKPFNVLPVLDRRTKKAIGMIRLHDIRSRGL
ncbi:MAG: KpsF/GutQ family sugar-phosphate isomerase [Elusimicrobia bacterium]|nr:KpsF/GutQ family sugar-phosphate isomerase [Elusimicrobiota bacterium]